jgi:nicotine blue oxidoreductase
VRPVADGRRVAGLLLAAGAGRRYGRPKALVTHDGRLMVERAVTTLRDGGCHPVTVVCGAAPAALVRRTATLGDAVLLDNPAWPTGMGSSLRAGLARLAVLPGTVVAAVVLLVDLPGVTPAAVGRLVAPAHRRSLAVAGYADGARGHPVLLGRDRWAAVAVSAVGDRGARGYLREHAAEVTVVPCADVADGTDVDHPPAG